MGSPLAKLYATLGLDTTGFDKGIAQTQSKTKAFTSSFKEQAKAGLGLGAGFSAGAAAFNLASDAISGTISFLSDAVSMAAEEEAAMEQLSKAIKENDQAWDGNIDAVEERIRAGERLAFEDNDQREALRLLIGYTHDLEDAERVLGVAMDFARFRGIELRAASDVLGKAMAGNTGVLGRYGIIVRKGADATEVLAQVQKMAAGQAEAYADTTAGKFIRAQLAMDNAMEDLGAAILPVAAELAELAADTIPKLMALVGDMARPLRDFAAGLDDIKGSVEGLQDTVNQATGGVDLVHGFADFVRIVGTGGGALAIDSLDDIQRGLQRASEGADIFAATGVDAFGKVSEGIGDMQDMANRMGTSLGDTVVEPPKVAEPIEEEMKKAVKQLGIGFGNIKQALERKPHFISDDQRERNMQKRVQTFRDRALAARRAGDSRAQRFYEEGLASQQIRLSRFTGEQRKQSKAAADVVGSQAKRGADKAISEGQRIKRRLDAIDLVATGRDMMTELAQGISEGSAAAISAASLAAQAIAQAFASVGGGALAGAAIQSAGITIAGNVYGGPAGLRQLNDEVTKATRPTRRHRD